LGLNTGDNVLSLSRVILVESHPAAYLIDILPPNIIDEKDIQEGFTGSVLDLLLRHDNLALSDSRCDIQAVAAPSSVARVLGIQRGDVLLKFIACLYTTNGTVVDYSLSYFMPGSFNFHVVRRIVPHLIK
jgi:GntR family transcriptional regulator